jgi:hypothetical protein
MLRFRGVVRGVTRGGTRVSGARRAGGYRLSDHASAKLALLMLMAPFVPDPVREATMDHDGQEGRKDDRRPEVRPDDRRREERSDRPDAGRRLDDRYEDGYSDRYDDRRRDYDRRDRDYDRRDYDRRDRGYDRRDRGRDDRYDDRYDERKRERSPEREAPKKKRGWDDMGADPANAALLLQQQQAFTMMQTQQMPSMPGSKKQRELYVGQLGQEQP